MSIQAMAQALAMTFDYYDTVLFDIIVEAVENTKNETGLALCKENVQAYHDYIIENFI